jgi:hypothetical protein
MANSSVSKVRDDIEVGSDMNFEEKWWKAEAAIAVISALFVIAGLFGFFGQGPMAKTRSEQAGITLEWERYTRFRTPTEIVVHLPNEVLRTGHARIWINGPFLDTARLDNVIPKPDHTEIKDDGVLFDFATDPNSKTAHVVFVQEPTKIGTIRGQISVEPNHVWNISSFVYP